MRVYATLFAITSLAAQALAGNSDNNKHTSAPSTMPEVKLDYTTVRAAAGNTTVGYYKYQNIRFAAAPTGDLRFAAPQWPPQENEVNNGTNLAAASVGCAATEDCLYLDVWAPANASGRKLPVLVWAYGGHFIKGTKVDTTPEGLFALSKDFIYVAYNYRVGIAGLGIGPTYQHEGGVANLCVWDATHAFEWVKKYIDKFGGNPNDVTAGGISAGASMVLFQMTRYGGNAPQLFNKAYLLSPAIFPGAGHHRGEQFWQNVSSAVGCTGGGIDCMRGVDFTTLSSAATSLVSQTSYVFQPRPDGAVVTDTYETNFYQGHFNFSGPLVISHAQHEVNTKAYTGVNSVEDIPTYLRLLFPAITDDVIDELLELYPESDYTSAGLRFADIDQTFEMTGKNLAITHALGNKTWNAEVGLAPANHTVDLNYYWYNPSSTSTTVNATIAVKMQKYLLSFVLTGNPNTKWSGDKLYWPRYDEAAAGNGVQIVFNDTFSTSEDDLANAKSLFANKALWY
jgi:carboxylesterase type B